MRREQILLERDFRFGSHILLHSASQPKIRQLLRSLQDSQSGNPISICITRLNLQEQNQVISGLLIESGHHFDRSLMTQLNCMGILRELQVSQNLLIKPSIGANCQTFRTPYQCPQILKLQQALSLLANLEFMADDSSKILKVRNMSHVVSFCNMHSYDSKLLLKLLLFQEYSLETKKIHPYNVQQAASNIKHTVKVLRNLVVQALNQKLAQCQKKQRTKQTITLIFNDMGFQDATHTQLSTYLTCGAEMVSTISCDPNFWLHVVPVEKRDREQFQQVFNQNKVQSDIRIHSLFRDYLSARQNRNDKLRLCLELWKSTGDRNISVKTAIDSIIGRLNHHIQYTHQRKANSNAIQKYLGQLNLDTSYKQRRGVYASTRSMGTYLTACLSSIGHQAKLQRREESVRKVQFSIRCFLLNKRLIRELQLDSSQADQETFQYQELIQTFNCLLNRCHKIREVEKRAYVSLQLISVKNNSHSALFSPNNLLRFVTECSAKYKGDECVQRIEVGDAVLRIVTNYRTSSYGVDDSDENQRIKQNGVGAFRYRMALRQGTLFGIGSNQCGQLGVGDFEQRQVASQVTIKDRVQKCGCGLKQTFCLTQSGKLYVWGLVKVEDRKTKVCEPLHVQAQGQTADIECSNYNSFALLDNRIIFQANNKTICYRESSASAIPFQIVCIRSDTLELILLKKVQFMGASLSLNKKREILASFSASKHPNKYSLQKIPSVAKEFSEHFNSHCIPSKEVTKNQMLPDLLE